MKIAVAGGTGVVGSYAVEAATAAGHDVVVLSRRRGVDVATGSGLAAALDGVDVVIDVMNSPSLNRKKAMTFFIETSTRLQDTGAAAGVKHIVTLSIVGIDKVPGYGYYQAKLAQEAAVAGGSLPVTIVRATQFHEFPAQILSRTHRGPIALIFRMRTQPIAARTVGSELVSVASGEPGGSMVEIAGPDVFELPDLARRVLASQGVRTRLVTMPVPGRAGAEMRSGAVLATPSTRIVGPAFDDWLASADGHRIKV